MPKREEAFAAHQKNYDQPLTQRDHDMFVAGWQALIDMLDGTDHIARVRETDFVIQHPVVERLEANLLECPITPLVQVACSEGHMGPGDYRVRLDRGTLQWDQISEWEHRR